MLVSATCRRFRQLLLPKIYESVHCYEPYFISFLELTSTYGSLCQELAVEIPRTGPTTELFCANIPNLVGLMKLDLNIREADRLAGPGWENTRVPTRWSTPMDSGEIRTLRSVLQCLPGFIISLRLSGEWNQLGRCSKRNLKHPISQHAYSRHTSSAREVTLEEVSNYLRCSIS